jgi:death-on-curing protein
MRYLTKHEVILINKLTAQSHGGQFMPPHNLLNEGALDYLLGIVCSDVFGQPLYPTLSDKTGLYMYSIISNHIFSDGNKRTGLEASILFLDLNGHRINKTLSKDIVFDFTMKVAAGQASLEECQAWFARHTVPEYL